ncbi:biorientation of chromosomes in cell division protein 1 [Caerostris extrusa]|uniref:Biorientation of chromosomes in cell division protein 1 n=1 Tax=Caerostris extrusa TaxID=172846 RepID=A0AAV4XBX3_CAEEX|nr:biorientation of chromosomes in cell division protein 1 [Caerostris extrusa]
MENQHLIPGDPILMENIVSYLKAKGIFDEFRHECLADVDTKSSCQNLSQRVDGYTTKFLSGETWHPDMNKNELRNKLRRHIDESGMLAGGADHVAEQVINPKITQLFLPKIAEVVHQYLNEENEKFNKKLENSNEKCVQKSCTEISDGTQNKNKNAKFDPVADILSFSYSKPKSNSTQHSQTKTIESTKIDRKKDESLHQAKVSDASLKSDKKKEEAINPLKVPDVISKIKKEDTSLPIKGSEGSDQDKSSTSSSSVKEKPKHFSKHHKKETSNSKSNEKDFKTSTKKRSHSDSDPGTSKLKHMKHAFNKQKSLVQESAKISSRSNSFGSTSSISDSPSSSKETSTSTSEETSDNSLKSVEIKKKQISKDKEQCKRTEDFPPPPPPPPASGISVQSSSSAETSSMDETQSSQESDSDRYSSTPEKKVIKPSYDRDVDISSVHTSDLSSFEDAVSLYEDSDSDEHRLSRKLTIKEAEKLLEERARQRRLERSKIISPSKDSEKSNISLQSSAIFSEDEASSEPKRESGENAN